ncbi:unnamed protein product [Ectocarpus sp. 6 AP-2014]
MRKSKTTAAGWPLSRRPLQSSSTTTPAALLATALLLGCAGSVLPSARAAAAAVGGGGAAPSSGVRSGRPSHFDDEREPLLPPLATTTLAPRGSRGGRSSTRPSWFVARHTRGGGLFRRRRGGGSSSDGGAEEGEKQKGGEEEGEEQEKEAVTEGLEAAAGTTGGSGSSGDEQEEEGAMTDGGGRAGEEQEDAAMASGEDGDGASEESGDGAVSGAPAAEGDEDGERGEEEGAGSGAGGGAAAATEGEERRRPVAPLFSFPPGPRVRRTEAEDSLQEVLPVQQRLVKYLTEDRVFGVQILCSVYFFMSAVAYLMDSTKFGGSYQAALAVLTLKQWGTVVGRVRRVLVPHLIYEPQSRYVKYRARVSALALDPAVQGIVYCGIFMLMPLSLALIPLLLKESVYLLWVMKEALQITAPGLVETLTTLSEPLMSVFMTAGDSEKWRDTPAGEKRLLLGRRLAQACFKLEMVMPFGVALRVLPAVLQTSLGAGGGVADGEGAEGAAAGAGGQLGRALPLVKVLVLVMAYVKLLVVKNGQLEDDVRILSGLKIRGYDCEWIERGVDSVVFGMMVGCPWWAGLLAVAFSLLPSHEVTKEVMASDDKLKTLGMTLLNKAIGRTPGADDDNDNDDEEEGSGEKDGSSGEGEESPPPSRMAKIAKVAAVATGVSDS